MGATPETETQLKTLMTDVVGVYEHQRSNAVAVLVPDLNTVDGVLVGTQLLQTKAQLEAVRSQIVNFIGGASDSLSVFMIEYCKVLGLAGGIPANLVESFAQVFRNYAENAKAVLSRGFVFGNPAAAGGNTGTGTIVTLHQDQWGQAIENTRADAKIARCLGDASSTARVQQEIFSIEGATRGRDALEEYGSGRSGALVGLSAVDSANLGVANPSFSSCVPAGVAGVLTDLGGWTYSGTLATDITAKVGTAGTDYYRNYDGDTTPVSLNITPNSWTLSQSLTATGGGRFKLNVPYYVHVAICRRSAADGTMTLTLGGSSVVVDLTTLTTGVWYVLKIVPGKASWYKNFGGSSITLSLARASGTTGTVDIDDWTVGEFQFFDGGYYAPIGGSTPFKVEDKFTWTDSETGNAINQKWMWRGPGIYLPSVPAAPTGGPTAANSATAGAVTAGVHYYTYTYVDAFGRESSPSPVSGSVTADGTKKVDISGLPGSPPANVATLKIYSNHAGAGSGGTQYYTGTSVTAGTTTVSVNAADGALTVAAPTGITWADPV